jgi:hypothetical protein
MRKSFFCFLTSIILLGNSAVWGQIDQVDHWESLIYPHQIWHFFPGTIEPPSDWKQLSYDDSSWDNGPGGIGYADGDDSTQIDPVISVFLRRKFNVIDTSNIAAMVFHMDYDDAFVAYINGVEVARANISGTNPPYNTESDTYREAMMYTGGLPQEFQIPFSIIDEILNEGDNVLAIQVHNRGINSSDMSAIPFLTVGVRDTLKTYMDPPDWFISPKDFYSSHLPLISINTLGNTIGDEPRIRAEMGVINNGPGEINHISDTFNGYHGWINIEIRGESSRMFPKKSYGFETQDSLGENNNVPLLGLPEENDWILYAPYSDKTLIKNVLSLKMARDMGQYASRTQYCELFIDGGYNGLYVLMEKIKRDKNRVDISNLRPEDIEDDQLTGGYILRIDKVDDNDYPPFVAYTGVSIPDEKPVNLQYFDPGGEELHMAQRVYIKDYIRKFEQSLNMSSYLSYFTGYHGYIDKDALIDYLIVNEISKNIDAYIFSTYLYKDRDSKGGKLTMGPAWDFNIAYGNVDYNESAEGTSGWMYKEGYRIYWFRRMMNDPVLQNKLSCRWHELRSNIFSDEVLFGYIDSLVLSLQTPIQDNFKRWPVLGQYVWPNSFIGNTHAQEIEFLKNWLYDRLQWMDANIDESCVEGIETKALTDNRTRVYPNPFHDQLNFESQDLNILIEQISIYDMAGTLIWKSGPGNFRPGIISWDGKNSRNQDVSKGIYLVRLLMSDGYTISRKIIKN